MTKILIDRATVEQALEALEYYRSGEDYQPTPASDAITALRAALAEPVQEPVQEPFALPCPTPKACKAHCCSGNCIPRSKA